MCQWYYMKRYQILTIKHLTMYLIQRYANSTNEVITIKLQQSIALCIIVSYCESTRKVLDKSDQGKMKSYFEYRTLYNYFIGWYSLNILKYELYT